jgi:hypothetical protein
VPSYLPLIGAVLGAVVGGFVGAWANSRYRDRETRKAEDREVTGLLRLIDIEIIDNQALLQTMTKEPAAIHPLTVAAIRTDAWASARATLVQHLTADDIDLLAEYYSRIHALKTVVTAYPEVQRDLPDSAPEKGKPADAWAQSAARAIDAGEKVSVQAILLQTYGFR